MIFWITCFAKLWKKFWWDPICNNAETHRSFFVFGFFFFPILKFLFLEKTGSIPLSVSSSFNSTWSLVASILIQMIEFISYSWIIFHCACIAHSMTVSFPMQRLLSLMSSHLFSFAFVICSQGYCRRTHSYTSNFTVSGPTFWSWIEFNLNFVYSEI